MIKQRSTSPWLWGSFCCAGSPLCGKQALIGALSGGHYAGLWALDDLSDLETAAVLQQPQEQPDLFVLKHQREGGGNNLYGQAKLY